METTKEKNRLETFQDYLKAFQSMDPKKCCVFLSRSFHVCCRPACPGADN